MRIKPATMTRLAQHLGFQGYEEVRDLYAEAIRNGELGFVGKAGVQAARQKAKGDEVLSSEMSETIAITSLKFPICRTRELLLKCFRIQPVRT